MKTGEITVKVRAEVVAYAMECAECYNEEMFGSLDYEDYSFADVGVVVVDDYKCANCGCDTFDVSAYIKTTLEK